MLVAQGPPMEDHMCASAPRGLGKKARGLAEPECQCIWTCKRKGQ